MLTDLWKLMPGQAVGEGGGLAMSSQGSCVYMVKEKAACDPEDNWV